MLNAEAVAHGVCRLQMWIDGADRDGGCCWRLASRRIAEAPVLQVDGRGKGRVAEFVEIHIALRCVIEDPETTTNGSFAVAEGREGKAKTRRKLAQRPVEPPGGSGRNRKNRRTVADGHVDQLIGWNAGAGANDAVQPVAALGGINVPIAEQRYRLGGIVETGIRVRAVVGRRRGRDGAL